MATNAGDFLRFVSCQEVIGREVCNVFYYVVAVWTGNATLEDLLNSFRDNILTVIAASQSNAVTHTRLLVENVTNGVDFLETAPNVQGTVSGQLLPPFVTATYRLNRSNKLTRAGRKAISGLVEEQLSSGVLTPGQSEMQAVSDILGASLLSDNGPGTDWAIDPVIVGRDATGALDLSRWQVVSSVDYPKASTQSTRKD